MCSVCIQLMFSGHIVMSARLAEIPKEVRQYIRKSTTHPNQGGGLA